MKCADWCDGKTAVVRGQGCAFVDHQHIDALIARLLPLISGGPGSTLILQGYKPPGSDFTAEACKDDPDFMEFWISTPDKPDVAFSIFFGGAEPTRSGFNELTLDRIREVALWNDPINVWADLANFDELWVFACKLGQAIDVEAINIRYGI